MARYRLSAIGAAAVFELAALTAVLAPLWSSAAAPGQGPGGREATATVPAPTARDLAIRGNAAIARGDYAAAQESFEGVVACGGGEYRPRALAGLAALRRLEDRPWLVKPVDTLTFSAVEARKLTGSTVPMEASAAGVGKLGVILRVPLGVVGAISPFNFPLNLVAHKLGPAIAAGNAVVLKPASQTPLSSMKLAEILIEAGLPNGWLSVIPGGGRSVGNALVEHELTAAISFTGSAPVGWGIRSRVPHKRVGLELGSNAPLIVNHDGDWEQAADKARIHAFSHAGQSCISTQRILVHEEVADRFTERLVANVEALKVGDPLDPETDVGPLISPADRDRVKQWIDEAVESGGEILTGGELVDEGRCLAPTVVAHPDPEARVWCEEIFGPVATVDRFTDFEAALERANDSKFGLQAGVFTRDLGNGIKAAETLEFGGVLINEVPTFRADQQPYGGVKDSGNTREGPAYSIIEMTEQRFVTFQGG